MSHSKRSSLAARSATSASPMMIDQPQPTPTEPVPAASSSSTSAPTTTPPAVPVQPQSTAASTQTATSAAPTKRSSPPPAPLPPTVAAPTSLPPPSAVPAQPTVAAAAAASPPIDAEFLAAVRELLAGPSLVSVNVFARPLAKRAAIEAYNRCGTVTWETRYAITNFVWRRALEACLAMRDSAVGAKYLNPKHEFIVLCAFVCRALEQVPAVAALSSKFTEQVVAVAPPGATTPESADKLAIEFGALAGAIRLESAITLCPTDIGVEGGAVLLNFDDLYKAGTLQ